jgi:hypothetical protein
MYARFGLSEELCTASILSEEEAQINTYKGRIPYREFSYPPAYIDRLPLAPDVHSNWAYLDTRPYEVCVK